MIRFGDRSYRESRAIIIAASVGESRNAPGTWEAHCAYCDLLLSIDLRSHLLMSESGVPAACLGCAVAYRPETLIHLADGRVITLGEAVEWGIVKITADREGDMETTS